MLALERRLKQPRWLSFAVPIAAIAFSFALMALVLVATGHSPGTTYRRIWESAFTANGALTQTIVSATPLAFTGLAAAVAFRMNLFNIGGEGQLYFGSIFAAYAGIFLGRQGWPTATVIGAMVLAGMAGGTVLALVPGVLRAVFSTNEIITSLMLNYAAGYLLNYLIFDSHSYIRDATSPSAAVFPQGQMLPDSGSWPAWNLHLTSGGLFLPLGFVLAIAAAAVLWVLYNRTRFGFEVQVIGDSTRAARYAGMRTRRKILAVMAISGAVAGLGGASQDGDFRHLVDARGLQQSYYGYTGIVVAALARYNPFAVVLVAVLIGGLDNAGYTLQGADFPSGLVGVMKGIILFSALGAEVLIRYRVRFGRPHAEPAA